MQKRTHQVLQSLAYLASLALLAPAEAEINLVELVDHPSQPVTESNWSQPEHIRWMGRNFSVKPSRILARGKDVYDLPVGKTMNLESMQFTAPGAARAVSMLEAFTTASVDGCIVIKDGQVVYERYFDGFSESSHHSWFSAAKSLIGMAIGILVNEGKIALTKSPANYLSALKGSAFESVTIQQVLNMRSALDYTFHSNAMTPGGLRYEYQLRAGIFANSHLASGAPTQSGPRGVRAMLPFVKPSTELKPGESFVYQNANVDVVGWLIEEVSGMPLHQFIRERVWVQLQTEHDALMNTDPNYTVLASGGLSSTLRDAARFGLAVLDNGKLNGREIFPATWVGATRNFSRADQQAFAKHTRFQGADMSALGAIKAYKNYWYIYDREQGAMASRGFAGQFVYVNKTQNLVMAVFSGASTDQNHERDRLMHFAHLLANRI
ncbi:MAG: serine hydrolase domain-containing protein [Pseudomonadales bacterium]